jgi:Holliday junction resolvasome RuvABC endonuclease subunit
MKKVKKATATATATATQSARILTLDVKQSHRMRQRLADTVHVDLFAVHSLKKASKGYVELCAEQAQATIDANKGKDTTHVLIAGAVANKVTLGKDGFYSRAHGNGAIVGNVTELAKLYGKDVSFFELSECEKRFAAIRETVTRQIGKRSEKRVHVGKEFATNGNCFAMFVRQANGKLAIFNGEFELNAYSHAVHASTVKTTQDGAASAEQRQAEKLASKG